MNDYERDRHNVINVNVINVTKVQPVKHGVTPRTRLIYSIFSKVHP